MRHQRQDPDGSTTDGPRLRRTSDESAPAPRLVDALCNAARLLKRTSRDPGPSSRGQSSEDRERPRTGALPT